MSFKTSIYAGLATATLLATDSHAAVSLPSLLAEMTNYTAVATWPEPAFTCKQASSYDRATIAPDRPGWFANSDQNQFVRTETNHGRTEKVMLDEPGPGCLVRFWLTTDRHKKGALRIYLDGADEPALTFPAYDLLSGDLGLQPPLAQPHPGYTPDGNGGNTLYLPIPYGKHCKVTWEEASQGARYYQINYRTYAPGTRVRTFTRKVFAQARERISQVNRILSAPPSELPGRISELPATLPPKNLHRLELPPGPAAVCQLELRVPLEQLHTPEQMLRSLVLQMGCDGEDTIWCPVSDFFGCGVGLNPVESWYRSADTNGTFTCRWIMPYRKNASLALANLGTQTCQATLTARVSGWSWDSRSMHFHATWHPETGLRTPPERDWNYITLTGRGVYVGDTLSLFNPVATWYGEGDEKISVDYEPFPSHMGTGTEDYYGFSYAPKPPHQTPFCGEPRMDSAMTQGHNVLTRTRNLDCIPFSRSLQFDMELISWQPTTLTYAATTYWYARPGTRSNELPQPEAAAAAPERLTDSPFSDQPPR
jgi:hypothetical protein